MKKRRVLTGVHDVKRCSDFCKILESLNLCLKGLNCSGNLKNIY